MWNKFLIYQRDPCHLQRSCTVYIINFVFYLIIRIRFILIISDVHKELLSLQMKNSNRKYKLRTGLFISWINRWGAVSFSIWFTGKQLRDLFVLNFVIKGKVISLPKIIKYVKRSKDSFYDFSAKHMPCAPLKIYH